jgi:molybdopterin-guanine dinucleotide biosynthesis protein A
VNTKQKTISCIILAGGRGKRFDNQDKGLIKLNNKPLIEHVIERIQPQVDDIVISANRNIETYNKYSSFVTKDSDDNYCGPLAGIASSIPLCNHEWALIVPCDMPVLPENLVDQMQKNIGNKNLCIAETNERLQLVILMHTSLLPDIQLTLDLEQYKLMDWISSQNHIAVHFEDDTAFNNINTLEQLSRLN